MPWTPSDADKHIKGLTEHQKLVWARVANSVLERCQKDGGADCDAAAIKQANAVAGRASSKKAKESMSEDVSEAGKRHSAADQEKIQAIHDHAMNLGATCSGDSGGLSLPMGGGLYASYREVGEGIPIREVAILKMKDSNNAVRDAVHQKLVEEHMDEAPPSQRWQMDGPAIRDMFPDQVVYDANGKTYKRKYAVDKTSDRPKVTFGKKTQVHVAYVTAGGPLGSSYNPTDPDNDNDNDTLNPDESKESLVFFPELSERNIPQSERDKIPAEDFAGKNKSFPIVKPEDVAAAAASIGRAGSDNYSTDELKARIIRIAKRKGPAFVAQLPEAWKDAKESETPEPADIIESNADEIEMFESIEAAFV